MKGLIHIYTGEGKGKTSAAIGLAVRSSGSGMKVLFTQFLKDGSSSEIEVLKNIPGIRVLSCTDKTGFIKYMNESEKLEAKCRYGRYFEEIISIAGDYDVLIIDEFMVAYNYDMIDRKRALEFIRNKPQGLELVLTGRDAGSELIGIADYVSGIDKIKHPFDRGTAARKGIEL